MKAIGTPCPMVLAKKYWYTLPRKQERVELHCTGVRLAIICRCIASEDTIDFRLDFQGMTSELQFIEKPE